MKKNGKLILITGLVMVCWLIVVLVFTKFDTVQFNYWCGLGFGIGAYVIYVLSILLIKPESNRNIMEINMIPVSITIAYLAIAVVFNTIMMFFGVNWDKKFMIGADLILIIAFLALRIFTNSYGKRVHQDAEIINQMTRSIAEIKVLLNELISMPVDDELKKSFLDLKQTVDYSNNTSQASAKQAENAFYLQVSEIINRVRANDNRETILAKVAEAKRTWLTRNSINASMQ